MKLSVIITTYNSEEWLEKVLYGYSVQTEKDFEIIIADDGSTHETKKIIDKLSHLFQFPILHIWQEDKGFRKSRILNKAILASNSDYLLFTDGDCVPRKDFVAQHLKFREKGYFLSGGYFKLPLITSKVINKDNIITQKCFKIRWLLNNGVKSSFKLSKLTKIQFFADIMNFITTTKKSWNGHNSSGFKKDILAVNGFNEEMHYGGMDRELGERLMNNGLKSKQIRYSAICIHLDHERLYSTKEFWKRNNEIREHNRKHKITYIEKGIHQKLLNQKNESI